MTSDDLPADSAPAWSALDRLTEMVGVGGGDSYYASLSDDELVQRMAVAVPRERGRGQPSDLAPIPDLPSVNVAELTDAELLAQAAVVRDHIRAGYQQRRAQAAVNRPHLAPAAGSDVTPPETTPSEEITEGGADEPAPIAPVTARPPTNISHPARWRVR